MLTMAIKYLTKSKNLPCFKTATISITHIFSMNRQRDEDNYTPKFLIDSLVAAGIISDDNQKQLRLLPPKFGIDATAWRTEIEIFEGKED